MAYVKEPVTKSNLKITCEFSTIILFIPGEFLALYNSAERRLTSSGKTNRAREVS